MAAPKPPKRSFTPWEKQKALDLYNSYDQGRFKLLVTEAGSDKNAEKGDAWNGFTSAYQQVW